MMAVSSNVGFTKVFDRLGGDRLGRWPRAFHFDAAPPIEGARSGEVPPRIVDGSSEGASVAVGASMATTRSSSRPRTASSPTTGAYVAPTLTLCTAEARAVSSSPGDGARRRGGARRGGQRREGHRREARITGRAWPARPGPPKARSRSGIEGIYAGFVGLVPAAHPRFVILVGIEEPRDGESGGKVAAPVFARVATRALGL